MEESLNEKLIEKQAAEHKAEVLKSLSNSIMRCYNCQPNTSRSNALSSTKSSYTFNRVHQMTGYLSDCNDYEFTTPATHFCSRCHTATCEKCFEIGHMKHSSTREIKNVK